MQISVRDRPKLTVSPDEVWRMNAVEIKALIKAHLGECMPSLGDDELDVITAPMTVVRLPAKHCWCQAGQSMDKMAFIVSGLCKMSYQTADGDEINVQFMAEQDGVGDYMAVIENLPSKYNIYTIEPTILMAVDKAHFEQCLADFPEFFRYVHEHTLRLLFRFIERTESFLISDSTARYVNFINDNPELAKRLSVQDLSSYLGMTRQSVTRIRKKLGQADNL
ncbi:Crp/Fnr family transcriptional regulator [Moraxella pluranimalium]|uniref:Cyclic nucleotide-binding domain-containing protein n=1 Tax=Moraxella pluranimalium TaxID=470453 RepID=A0A1T0CPJ2_9GAMM|nr:Crp/Fnr family transcriptional regulator [Moraxella pluranimalium]OOS24267.1 hypothetical protein B0680_05695 [Moraxella pluranimalium]